jgi:Cdc6-like AAA superfamily ATPase
LKKQLEAMKDNGGGVIFVDEAYQLEPSTNQQGAQVLNFIIPLAERLEGEYGKLVWIFAGYVDDMERLFNFNVGLTSRFPTRFIFEDYTDDELETIFRQYLKNEPPPPSAAQKKKEEKERKEKERKEKERGRSQATANSNANALYASMYGGNPGETRVDDWGNNWTLDLSNSRWVDEYGNMNAFGPLQRGVQNQNMIYAYGGRYQNQTHELGSTLSPIVNDKTGVSWCFNKTTQQWYNVSAPQQTSATYPGKPPPPKKISKRLSIPFHVEDEKWIRIAIRRVASRRKMKGFGNARDVRLLFDKCIQRQSDRISRVRQMKSSTSSGIDLHLLTRNDILGPKASADVLKSCPEYGQLLAMEGLSEMKKVIQEILEMVIVNSDREEREEPLHQISLNRVFFGNPGTGKTTVAQLYGKILCSLGILSKGDTVLKNPSDFIGGVIGSSEANTRAILSAAEGCVLVIDEAYMLNPTRSTGSSGGLSSSGGDPFKTAVLDTLVEQVQGVPGDDRVVLLLGYKRELEEMFQTCNPGLSRRFQFDNPIVFSDYDDAALMKIMRAKVAQCGLTIDIKTALFAIQQLTKKRSLPNFGNAGEVNNMLNDAKRYVASRHSNALRQEDFCKGGVMPTAGLVDTVMKELIGNEDIDKLVEDYKNLVDYAKGEGVDVKEFIDYNFLFVGSPGTGLVLSFIAAVPNSLALSLSLSLSLSDSLSLPLSVSLCLSLSLSLSFSLSVSPTHTTLRKDNSGKKNGRSIFPFGSPSLSRCDRHQRPRSGHRISRPSWQEDSRDTQQSSWESSIH